VNRAATAWLIRRFIDPDATFFFVEPGQVVEVQRREEARGFDAPDATYPHTDDLGRCSFEALVDEYCSGDATLRALAQIVRGADLPDQIDVTPESAGLRAISHGFPLVTHDDYETLEKASFLYDALYAFIRERNADRRRP
jgi:hypothetical protein